MFVDYIPASIQNKELIFKLLMTLNQIQCCFTLSLYHFYFSFLIEMYEAIINSYEIFLQFPLRINFYNEIFELEFKKNH